jgi:predicted RNase H-like nuclease (RuvC/YqgF family)
MQQSQHQQESGIPQPHREVDQDEDTVGLSAANTIRVLRAKLKAQEQDIEMLSQKLSHKEREVSKTDDSYKDLREDLAKETRLRAHAQAAAEKFKKLLDEKVSHVPHFVAILIGVHGVSTVICSRGA